MEMWDGVTTYEGGSTMPDWTEVSFLLFGPYIPASSLVLHYLKL